LDSHLASNFKILIMKNLKLILLLSAICFSQFVIAQDAPEEKTQESAADLAKKLANPISSLISLPFQNNTDLGIGPNNGSRNTLNIQPVLPISLNENLNLITRMILPVISQYNVTGLGNTETGLGDIVLSAFLSPAQSKNGLTWGAGPVFLIPTATDDFLGAKKFGVGPTAVGLYQTNGITIGALINQIWSVAGDKDRNDVSSLFFQPFFNYNWKSGAGIGGNFEITQNWESDTTVVWFNPTISAVTSLGKQKTQLAIGPRFNLAAPSGSKADIGFRAVVVFLFPK
jgi:hypothetical protein